MIYDYDDRDHKPNYSVAQMSPSSCMRNKSIEGGHTVRVSKEKLVILLLSVAMESLTQLLCDNMIVDKVRIQTVGVKLRSQSAH